jgi:two-component sensor histidine kinase
VDIFNDTVVKSPENGSIINFPVAFDINNDGYNEYMGKSCAFGNFYRDSIDYPDTHAWLMVLDRKMNFLFEPQKFGQYKTTIDVKPFRPFKTNYLVALQIHYGQENIDNKLILFDSDGNEIKERILEDFSGIENSFLMSRDNMKRNDLYLIHDNGEVEQLDTNLQTINVTQIDNITGGKPIRVDIDLDGVDEFLFGSENMQELILTRNDFSHPVILKTPNDFSSGLYCSVIQRGDKRPQLFIQFGANSFIFEYFKNPLYYFKYAIYAVIFAGVYLLVFLIFKMQQIRAKHKYETEKKIAELQLKYIKTQTDPHFTLNILNSLGTLFYQNDPDKANYIFGKYAQMLRNTILRSDDISISLSEEIDYVENFLELEKFRLNNKFDYKIEIAENVNQDNKVPKMLLHTFVENAIKHGIRHLETKGELNISLEASNKNYIFTITDNGVGRIKAKEYSKFSTGKGLKILDKILGLYFNLEGIKIKYDIVDLYDNFGDPAGTKVVINVPVKINVSPD